MNKKQEIIRGHLTCTCDEAYKSRNMVDPNCFLCEYESEIELMMQEYVEQQLKNCNLQSVNAPLQPVKLICKNCNGWYGININHKCFKCLDDNFVDLNRNGR